MNQPTDFSAKIQVRPFRPPPPQSKKRIKNHKTTKIHYSDKNNKTHQVEKAHFSNTVK